MDFVMSIQDPPVDAKVSSLDRESAAMTGLRDDLAALGMAFTSALPEFPDNDHLDRTDFHDGHPVSERGQVYARELERTLAEHGAGPLGDGHLPGIPAHKLFSADRWHVTAGECAEALAAYDTACRTGLAQQNPLDPEVIPFLRAAAVGSGFLVH